jgi:hypothetical protein
VFVRDGNAYRAVPVEVMAEAGARAYITRGLDARADVATTDVATLKAAWAAGGG